MTWAVECRRTSRASRSLGVSSRSWIGSAFPFSRGRSRSTTVPLATAAIAASARRFPIDSATSRGLAPSGKDFMEPSGSEMDGIGWVDGGWGRRLGQGLVVMLDVR